MKNEPKLLSRQVFSEAVLKRDNHTCVFCKDTKVVVHHIIERKLFGDGGYYIDNGASVCDEHHWSCEKTDISVEEVRLACKIKTIIIPVHFDVNLSYDKWGNIVLSTGMRLEGEMFHLENVQKVLKDKLYLFSN